MAAASFRKELEVRPGDSYAIENLPLPLLHAGRWAEAQVAAALAVQTPGSGSRLPGEDHRYAPGNRCCAWR